MRDIIKYLGVHITAGRKFCCSLSNAKRSFCRAFHCIFWQSRSHRT